MELVKDQLRETRGSDTESLEEVESATQQAVARADRFFEEEDGDPDKAVLYTPDEFRTDDEDDLNNVYSVVCKEDM